MAIPVVRASEEHESGFFIKSSFNQQLTVFSHGITREKGRSYGKTGSGCN